MNMTQDTTKTVASPSGLQRVTVLGTGVLGGAVVGSKIGRASCRERV